MPDLTLGTPFKPPVGLAAGLFWFLGLPINIAYFSPSGMRRRNLARSELKWVAVSFIVCVAWIAVSCYTLVWMVTIIGYSHLRSRMQSWVLHSSLLEAVYQIARQVWSAQEKVSYVIIPVVIDHNTHSTTMATRLSHKCHVDRCRTHLERD